MIILMGIQIMSYFNTVSNKKSLKNKIEPNEANFDLLSQNHKSNKSK